MVHGHRPGPEDPGDGPQAAAGTLRSAAPGCQARNSATGPSTGAASSPSTAGLDDTTGLGWSGRTPGNGGAASTVPTVTCLVVPSSPGPREIRGGPGVGGGAAGGEPSWMYGPSDAWTRVAGRVPVTVAASRVMATGAAGPHGGPRGRWTTTRTVWPSA